MCEWEQFAAKVWWRDGGWGSAGLQIKSQGLWIHTNPLTQNTVPFDTKRRRFHDEDNQEQFAYSSCAHSLLGGCQQHSATCPKFSVEPETGLKTFGGLSSLTDPLLIPHFFGHKDCPMSWWSRGKVTCSYSHLSNCHSKAWAPAADQTALPGHINTRDYLLNKYLGLSPEKSLFFGWFDNQKVALASAWNCVVLQLQWTPTFSKLQNICCHFQYSKLLVL